MIEPVSRRVLVVDDEPAIRELVADVASIHDIPIVGVGTADEALAVEGIVGALVDLTLPGADGFSVIEALVAREPAIPCVLVTGAVSTEVRQRCATLGAGLLEKPFGIDALEARLLAFVS